MPKQTAAKKEDDSLPFAVLIPIATLAACCAILASPGATLGPDGEGAPRIEYVLAATARPALDEECGGVLAPLLRDLHGTVLDLDASTGAWLQEYTGAGKVLAATPRPFLLPALEAAAAAAAPATTVLNMSVTNMSQLEDRSVDAIVSVRALCPANWTAAAAEMKRVLKPKGRIAFLEPAIALEPQSTRRVQTLISPFYELFSYGCRLDRDVQGLLLAEGFRVTAEPVVLNTTTTSYTGHHLLGTAQR